MSMPFSSTMKAIALNSLDIASMGLHSDYEGLPDFIRFELDGGSPPYSRQPCLFYPAAGNLRSLVEPVVFDVPDGSTVAWISLWDPDDQLLGIAPNGGETIRAFAVLKSARTTLLSPNHGFVAGLTVIVTPTAFNFGNPTKYYVKAVGLTTNSFQISTTREGPAEIMGTAESGGNGFLQTFTPQLYAEQGVFTVDSFNLDANLHG